MKTMFTRLLLLGAFCLGLTACSGATTGEESDKLKVTTTIAQIGDIVANVGGEHVEVESLMGPGIDPHLYQASQGDIGKLSKADIIFYNGLHLEGKMGDILEKMSKDKPTVAVGEKIPEELLLTADDDAKKKDPHVWFDITLWIHAVEAVTETLVEQDKENAETYEENAANYIKDLKELDAYGKEQIASIPEESRVLVTAHDAFKYFGEAYGMEVTGLQGLSTDAEFGLRDVQSIIDLLVERNVKAVFVESSISEDSINAVVKGAESRGHTVVIGGELYSDAMGEAGTETGTYLGMFKHNIDTIVNALK
ncbi:manganese/zinc/iron transport system substrate-binding protein [Bacillus tianshenii]|uniref:Manganese/zinc/iron transport system substrate-binding protein n=1 Tax=Sutcliffiella tianshenii TaxID=1463404 RepID=A0ABS2P3A7_9BACI|nr:zinc ABC transporter substrate-binding protein [Bacillus tianshenii]MBM7621447.1 manganese/zinc/iron transport system substrate-binding protein [Bacillus tianshenii]